MSTTSLPAVDPRAALTDLARSFGLPIRLRSFWRIEIKFDASLPAEDVGTNFDTAEAARKLANRINDDGLKCCRVTGPFEEAVVELPAIVGKSGDAFEHALMEMGTDAGKEVRV